MIDSVIATMLHVGELGTSVVCDTVMTQTTDMLSGRVSSPVRGTPLVPSSIGSRISTDAGASLA